MHAVHRLKLLVVPGIYLFYYCIAWYEYSMYVLIGIYLPPPDFVDIRRCSLCTTIYLFITPCLRISSYFHISENTLESTKFHNGANYKVSGIQLRLARA